MALLVSDASRRFVYLGAIFALLTILLASPVAAGDPRLSSFTPLGGARGADIEVRLGGTRIGDAVGLLLYEPGITVKEIKPVKDSPNATDMVLAIAPDCRLGFHAVRVRTATGLSNLRLFSVGSMPQVPEKKAPNNDPTTAQSIDLDTTINGNIGGEETDYYVVDVKQGERITAEIEALRLGRAVFDPVLAILDSEGKELASSDDIALLYADAVVSVVAPAAGKYFVTVREATFGTGSTYRLHVGRYPRPRAIYPAGGKLGEKISVKLIGDAGGDQDMQVTLPKTPQESFAIFAQNERGIAPSGNPFHLSRYAGVLEAEPNDDLAHATAGAVPGTFNGIIAVRGDVDHFKFATKKGQQYEAQLYGRSLRSPIDSYIQVLRANGAPLGANDDTATPDSTLRFTAAADEDCILLVKDMLGDGSPEHVYHVEIRHVEPTVVLTLPELKRYEDVIAEIPQGNRMAVLMNVSRRDYNGEVQVDVRGLPPGVKAEPMPFKAGEATAPVLLTATDDAPLANALVDMVGKITVKKGDVEQAIEGHMTQESQILRGPNNKTMIGWTADRMATAVTQRVPFKLELVEPRVPLVRSGAMDLKVRVVRDKDFKLPIVMRMVYNSPGVSSSSSVKIGESENEGVMPLANKDAATGKFKIAVVGEVAMPEGPVMASTQFVTLEVAESFFTFTYTPVPVEQSKETDFVIDVEGNTKFAGKARAELLGLPVEATAEPVEFAQDASEIKFRVKTTAKTTGGRHKSILCRVVVMMNDEPVTHILGPGELRVDVPIQQKKDVAAPKKESAKAAPAKPEAGKK